jgi:hypothetical protein
MKFYLQKEKAIRLQAGLKKWLICLEVARGGDNTSSLGCKKRKDIFS